MVLKRINCKYKFVCVRERKKLKYIWEKKKNMGYESCKEEHTLGVRFLKQNSFIYLVFFFFLCAPVNKPWLPLCHPIIRKCGSATVF